MEDDYLDNIKFYISISEDNSFHKYPTELIKSVKEFLYLHTDIDDNDEIDKLAIKYIENIS